MGRPIEPIDRKQSDLSDQVASVYDAHMAAVSETVVDEAGLYLAFVQHLEAQGWQYLPEGAELSIR